MKRLAGFVALASLAWMFACGTEATSASDDDAGLDAGTKDSGRDARATTDDDDDDDDDDTGTKDGGAKKDAGNDGGGSDGGSSDSGSSDAGDLDASNPDASDAASDPDASNPDGGADPTPTSVWLSEVFADPPGTDANNEFVELGCVPGLSLASYWFVIVDGDLIDNTPTNPGTILFKKKLTGITCGTTGYVVLQRGGVYDEVAGTTYVDKFFVDNIQNGSQTYLLVKNDTFDPTDLDGDDDGVIDDAGWLPKIVDSVAVSDGTVGDKAYSKVLLEGGAIDAIARFSNTPARAASSWYFGAIMSNPAAPPSFIYDPAEVSPNFPADGALTPGAANSAL